MKIVSVFFVLAFCSTAFAKTAAAPEVTFHQDVEPILQKNCQTCHRAGEIAPFAAQTKS